MDGWHRRQSETYSTDNAEGQANTCVGYEDPHEGQQGDGQMMETLETILAVAFMAIAAGIVLGAYLERPKRDSKGRFTK